MLLDHGIAVLCHCPYNLHDVGICLLLLAYANLFLLKSECFKTKDKKPSIGFCFQNSHRVVYKISADRG